MFLLSWFYGVLALLGLWQKEAKILFLGDNNGRKTMLLHMHRDEDATWEEFSIGTIKFKTFNWSHQNPRGVLRDYNVQFDAVVWLVDWPVDFSKELEFFWSVQKMGDFLAGEALQNLPVLILVEMTDGQNYDDERYFMADLWAEIFRGFGFTSSERLMRSILGLDLEDPNVEPPVVCVGSIERNMGYRDGFQQLSQRIQ